MVNIGGKEEGTYGEWTVINMEGIPISQGSLLWLVNEEASGFVTGISVPVDGGFMAYSGV